MNDLSASLSLEDSFEELLSPEKDLRKGWLIAAGFFVVLLGWAALTPLDAGAMAQQTLLTSGSVGTLALGATYAMSYSSSATGISATDTAGVVSAGTTTWGPLFSAPDTLAFQRDAMPEAYRLIRVLYRYVNTN